MRLFNFKNKLQSYLTLSKVLAYRIVKLQSKVIICLLLLVIIAAISNVSFLQNLFSPFTLLFPPKHITTSKQTYEILGFLPYWNIKKLQPQDLSSLTTLAYFGVPILPDGSLDKEDYGYITFRSPRATMLFNTAHSYGVKVILTVTQMDNDAILALLDDRKAQNRAITNIVREVKGRGVDGINVDFEYTGDPGGFYKDEFSSFIKRLSSRLYNDIPGSTITVSVYAASAISPKMYDIKSLASSSNGLFMMAYDFATASSPTIMPTAPLNGHKQGKYWYDVASAVDDFLQHVPPHKVILGVPYYGYNYPVLPDVSAQNPTRGWGNSHAQTYSYVTKELILDDISEYEEGWDKEGVVGYKKYYDEQSGTYRIIYMENTKSLSAKYDFAISRNLKGIGIWALGMDNGRGELRELLSLKFGNNRDTNALFVQRAINEYYD